MPNLLPIQPLKLPGRASVREGLFILCDYVESLQFDEYERVSVIGTREGKSWVRVKFEDDLAGLSQSASMQNGAEIVSQEITFSLPSLNPDTRQLIRILADQHCLHCLLKDDNGRWQYCGISFLPEQGVWVSEKMRAASRTSNTGSDSASGRSEYQVTLSARVASDAPFLAPDFDFSEIPVSEPDPGRLVVDTTPPEAVAFVPQEGSDFVDRDFSPLQIVFNEPIKRGNPAATITLRRFDDDTILQTWTMSETQRVTIDPLTNSLLLDRSGVTLDYSTAYYVQAQADSVRDLAGYSWAGIDKAANALDVWYLATGAEPDTIGPTVSAYLPVNGGTQSLPGDPPEVQWSEPVQPGSGNVTITRVSDSATIAVLNVATSARISTVGNRLILDVLDLLEGLTQYTISGPGGIVEDNAFNASDNFSWTFETGADQRPSVADVDFSPIPPNVGVLNTPQGTYDGKGITEGTSIIEVRLYDQETGTAGEQVVFTGQPGESFTPLLAWLDRWLEISYTPVNVNGDVGALVKSPRRQVGEEQPPTAIAPNFTALPQAGTTESGTITLTPTASYSSPNGVPEGASTWEAYLYDNAAGTSNKTLAGSGVKGDTLSLTASTIGATTTPKWIQLEWVPVDANGLEGPLVRSVVYPVLLDEFIEFVTAETALDIVTGPSNYIQVDFGDGAGFEVFDVSSNPTTISKTGLSSNPKTVRIRGRAGANPLLKVVDAGISDVAWSDDFFLNPYNEMNLSGNQIDVQAALADLLPLIPSGLAGFVELALYGNNMPASPYPDSMLRDAVDLYNLTVRVRADWYQLSTGGL